MSRRTCSALAMLVVAAVLRAAPAPGAEPTPTAGGARKEAVKETATQTPATQTPAVKTPVSKVPATKASATKASATKASPTQASVAKPPAAKTTPRAAAKQPARREGATRPAKAAPRRLEDIHIEGEIPVPQVLFITARDQRRFMDFHHHRYLKTSRELGEATAFPTRIVVTGTGGNDDRKETSR